MKKRMCAVLTAILAAALVAAGCEGKKKFVKLADFRGARIASEKGTIFAQALDSAIGSVKHLYCNSQTEVMAAVFDGTADAASLDMPIARYIVSRNPELVIFPHTLKEDRYGFAIAKGSEFAAKANEILRDMEGRGTIRRLREAWLFADEGQKTLPDLTHKADFDGSAGTLRFGCGTSFVPLSYVGSDGKPAGFDLDIASRMAYELNMKIEFFPMNFGNLLNALVVGKVDMAGCNISITEERLESFDFVGPYLDGGIVLVIKRGRAGKWYGK